MFHKKTHRADLMFQVEAKIIKESRNGLIVHIFISVSARGVPHAKDVLVIAHATHVKMLRSRKRLRFKRKDLEDVLQRQVCHYSVNANKRVAEHVKSVLVAVNTRMRTRRRKLELGRRNKRGMHRTTTSGRHNSVLTITFLSSSLGHIYIYISIE